MAAHYNIDDSIKIGVGHGRSGWQAQAPIEQIFCNRPADNPRRITLLTPY